MTSLSTPIHQSPQVVTLKFLKATISEEMKQEWLDAFDITIQENGSSYLSKDVSYKNLGSFHYKQNETNEGTFLDRYRLYCSLNFLRPTSAI